MKYFCIFDKKNGSYNPQLFAATSIPEAVRMVAMSLEEGKNTLAKFPADFQLYMVGDFEHTTGVMTPATPNGPMMIQEVSQIMSESLLGKAVK